MSLHYRVLIACYIAIAVQSAYAQAQSQTVTVAVGHAGPWQPLAEKDIAWKQKIWRELPLLGPHANNATWRSLYDTICAAIARGAFMAYIGANDKLSVQFTPKQAKELLAATPASAITAWHIKEDLIQVKGENNTMTRILGMAPVAGQGQPLFWIYYPNCRDFLSATAATSSLSWYDILEDRKFNSTIISRGDSVMNGRRKSAKAGPAKNCLPRKKYFTPSRYLCHH